MASGGFLADDEPGEIAEINVTPLVDIMLVLLVIFMATATYITSGSLEVELPQAQSSSQQKPSGKAIQIVVHEDGHLLVDNEKIESDELDTLLMQRIQDPQQVHAIVAADRHAHYGTVVEVIDHIRGHGIAVFSLQVEH